MSLQLRGLLSAYCEHQSSRAAVGASAGKPDRLDRFSRSGPPRTLALPTPKEPALREATPPSTGRDLSTLDKACAALDLLHAYHGYEIEGLENVPTSGRCLVAFNHSLATYDVFLFAKEAYRHRGRPLRMLGDHVIFNTPGLKQIATALGAVDGRPELAKQLVQNEELVGVAPGGVQEQIRPSGQKYELKWDERKGFARLAMETGTPVVLAACPTADDLYRIYDSPLTRLAYRYTRFPVPVFAGLGGVTILPKHVKLRHVVGKPMAPPPMPRPDAKRGDADYDQAVNEFHGRLVKEMEQLMARALALCALPAGSRATGALASAASRS